MASDKQALGTATDSALELIRVFRSMSPDMPMQQAEIFLHIARKPGISMRELEKTTGLAQSSVSRNLAALSQFHRLDKPGLNLIEGVLDPTETRRRIFFLTQQGREFYTRLIRPIDPDFSVDKDTDARLEVQRIREEALAQAPAPSGKGRAKAPSYSAGARSRT